MEKNGGRGSREVKAISILIDKYFLLNMILKTNHFIPNTTLFFEREIITEKL